jgi:hypothetical protein
MSPPLLRETPHYLCTAYPRRGWVRITAKTPNTFPTDVTISPILWQQLNPLPDAAFDAACVLTLDFGSRSA